MLTVFTFLGRIITQNRAQPANMVEKWWDFSLGYDRNRIFRPDTGMEAKSGSGKAGKGMLFQNSSSGKAGKGMLFWNSGSGFTGTAMPFKIPV